MVGECRIAIKHYVDETPRCVVRRLYVLLAYSATLKQGACGDCILVYFVLQYIHGHFGLNGILTTNQIILDEK